MIHRKYRLFYTKNNIFIGFYNFIKPKIDFLQNDLSVSAETMNIHRVYYKFNLKIKHEYRNQNFLLL